MSGDVVVKYAVGLVQLGGYDGVMSSLFQFKGEAHYLQFIIDPDGSTQTINGVTTREAWAQLRTASGALVTNEKYILGMKPLTKST